MKKRDLTALAMIGISAGLVAGGCQQNSKSKRSNTKVSAAEQLSPDMQAFYAALTPEAKKKFMDLDAQHKMMAVEMANQRCNGQNSCSGMGGCATSKHSCAGQNSCKGQGGSPVKEPTKAVTIQYKNQMEQRHKTNGKMQNGSKDSSRY